MRQLSFVVIVLVVLLSAACASAGPPGESRGGTLGSGTITREELAALRQFNAFQVVRRLRPQWLRSRGVANLDGQQLLPVVFVDRTPRGEPRELQQISADDVERITFMSARDATTRYGTGYPGGIIEVISRGN
jgi:hypothetical protein